MPYSFQKSIGNSLLLLVFFQLFFLTSTEAGSVKPINWRFFTASDGLRESYSQYVTVSPSGKVWVKHGSIDMLSWLDGLPAPDGKYVNTLPSPSGGLRIFEGYCGQLWCPYENGIQLFNDGRWIKYKVDEINPIYFSDTQTSISFLPVGFNQVFFLLPDRLMLFNAETMRVQVIKKAKDANLGRFIDMIFAWNGGGWITGEKGIAKLGFESGTLTPSWREHLLGELGVKDVQEPVEGKNEELFAMAVNHHNNKKETIHFDGNKWRILSGNAGDTKKVWPGLDGGYWTLKGEQSFATLSLLHGSKEEAQEKVGILLGDFHDVSTEKDGVFWVATSNGLARYTPPIWRTPVEVKNIRERISSIHEDPVGRIWFGAINHLLKYQDGEWKIYQFPENIEIQKYATQSICSLPDGRIAIGITPSNNFVIVFDPDRERFDFIPHLADDSADGSTQRFIGAIAPRRDGTIWIQTFSDVESSEYRLEIFDGKTFTFYLDRGDNWKIGKLKYLYEDRNGGLWIGGSNKNGLALYNDGKYNAFVDNIDIESRGAFCISEVEEGKIWIGGRDNILQFDGHEWSVVRQKLAGVRSIVTCKDSSILVASDNGIHKYVNGTWITNTVEDGLPNTATFSILEDSKGRIWAGTINGLSLYHPEADTAPPETIVSEVENLSETPPDGEVRILYSGLDKWNQTRTDRLLFSYRLDKGRWSPFETEKVALFNQVPFGKHRFEVRAMDTNNNIDPEPAIFQFTVLVPWYKETGFLFIVGISSIIILFLLGYASYRHIALERLVVKRTRDLQQNHNELELTLEYERLLATIAAMLNSTSNVIDVADNLVERIARSVKVENVSLFGFNNQNKVAKRLSSYSSPLSLVFSDVINLNFSDVPSVFKWMFKGDSYCLADVSLMDEKERIFFENSNVRSFIFVPVKIIDETIGCLSFCRNQQYIWNPEEKELFRTIADIFASSWQRHTHFKARLEAEKKQTEAVQLAEKTSRMASIGVMAAGITHEINQPLNSMRIVTQGTLLDIERNNVIQVEEMRGVMAKVYDQIMRIDKIIKHMKAFWVSPAISIQENFDFNKAIKNALSLIDAQTKTHGIILEKNIEQTLSLIKGSQIHLEQIVINLMVNSIYELDCINVEDKYIRVITRQKNGFAILEVEDNGQGFNKDYVEKIFDPFYSTKKPGEGVGLGLAIVERFVEGLGGSIEARNKKSGGAKFTLKLPVTMEK
jgi:signal transduction histidine kinase/ligand-binding sensor domain-containing protein